MTQNDFRNVRMDLNPRKYRALARQLPWPYNGMVNDVIGCIQTKGNYLAALGLICYTEICGRTFFFGGSAKVDNWKCFNKFLEYAGGGDILKKKVMFKGKKMYFYAAVRNGLAHQYFMKVDMGGVYMITDKPEANRLGFEVESKGNVRMVVVPYFKLFCEGLRKAKQEGKLTLS